MFIHLLLASQQAQGSGMSMIIMLLLMFVIMWFFMIRPQQKKQKEIQNFQNSLKSGDEVVTGGGLHGIVKRIDHEKNIVEVEIARGVVVTCDKGSVFRNGQPRQ